MIDSYLASLEAEGVDNARDIYEAAQDHVARFSE
jgi:hypothetical protein